MGLLSEKGRRYDASYTETTRLKRHGLPWEEYELENLKALFDANLPLKSICERMERPPAGVLGKLLYLGCIGYDTANGVYYYTSKSADLQTQSKQKAQKETTMTKPIKIETRTFINEVDAFTMSDEQIFAKIAELENTIKSYSSINNKPKMLLKAIERLEANINELVAYVDGR